MSLNLFILFSFLVIILLTLLTDFNKYIIYNMNNTRLASAGFGRLCAPRWVTYIRGLGGAIH